MSPRPDSVHSTTSSSDSHDSEENYVSMNPNQSSEDPVCNIYILTTLPVQSLLLKHANKNPFCQPTALSFLFSRYILQ